jgi:hypothetical protein
VASDGFPCVCSCGQCGPRGAHDCGTHACIREPAFLSEHGYRVQVVTLDGSDQFYWHVWHQSEHVNGGLSESLDDARYSAARAARQDFTHYRAPRWR